MGGWTVGLVGWIAELSVALFYCICFKLWTVFPKFGGFSCGLFGLSVLLLGGFS